MAASGFSELAQKGQRVLGFAYKTVPASSQVAHEEVTDLVFIGLAGIIDPPKDSAIKAVRESLQAGIRVKMITGDHKETAQAHRRASRVETYEESS